MKLIKTEKQFTNPFIEGALDIYADIENGNECGENNAWIELDCSALFLGLSRQRIEAYFTSSKTSEEVKACLSSAKIFARGQTREKNFISWRGFGLLVANYASYVKNAMSILDTWQHYSWVADIEKEIVGQAETFLKLAKECKERGDKRGFYSFMERYESEKEWEAKLKAEKERADKAEDDLEESKQRDIKTIVNDLQATFYPSKIHNRVNRLMRERKVWDGQKVNKDWSFLFSAYKPIKSGFFFSLQYNKGMGEKAYKLIRDWIEIDIERETRKKERLF